MVSKKRLDDLLNMAECANQEVRSAVNLMGDVAGWIGECEEGLSSRTDRVVEQLKEADREIYSLRNALGNVKPEASQ
jgi:anion-transporting  ArsA/GET3 family ATPase